MTAGAQDVTRLYPAGKRLLKPERGTYPWHMLHELDRRYSVGIGIVTADAEEETSAIGNMTAWAIKIYTGLSQRR